MLLLKIRNVNGSTEIADYHYWWYVNTEVVAEGDLYGFHRNRGRVALVAEVVKAEGGNMGMMNQRDEQIVHLHHSQIQDFFAISVAISADFTLYAKASKCLVKTRGEVAGMFLSFWKANKDKYQFPGYSAVTVKQITLEVVRYYYEEVTNV
jgi:hypothetical protein